MQLVFLSSSEGSGHKRVLLGVLGLALWSMNLIYFGDLGDAAAQPRIRGLRPVRRRGLSPGVPPHFSVRDSGIFSKHDSRKAKHRRY